MRAFDLGHGAEPIHRLVWIRRTDEELLAFARLPTGGYGLIFGTLRFEPEMCDHFLNRGLLLTVR